MQLHPTIKRSNIDSSNIDSLEYSIKESILIIRFKQGGRYAYHKVGLGTVLALINAESKGKYFHKNIKDKFNYEKI